MPGGVHGYRFVNDLPLNKTHPLRVNSLEYGEVEGGQERLGSWITDLRLTYDNLEPLRRGGRARGKSEKETFNTLKTQGYEREHP
jgi:hypothetical protein